MAAVLVAELGGPEMLSLADHPNYVTQEEVWEELWRNVNVPFWGPEVKIYPSCRLKGPVRACIGMGVQLYKWLVFSYT